MPIETIVFLAVAGFVAAAIDSIAGGGGIISLPAIIAAGVPPHLALGTNKFASSCASLTSTVKFAFSGKIDWKLVRWQIPCTFVGAALGVRTVLAVDEKILNFMIVALVFAVAIYTILKRDFGKKDNFRGLTRGNVSMGMGFAFALGFYDGFFGPGTGSFLIFLFIGIYGYDFTRAAGNGKILNFASNVVSLVLFALGGKIVYAAAVPMALAMIAGAWFGTHIAITKGAKVIKPIFVTIATALIVKLVWQAVAS